MAVRGDQGGWVGRDRRKTSKVVPVWRACKPSSSYSSSSLYFRFLCVKAFHSRNALPQEGKTYEAGALWYQCKYDFWSPYRPLDWSTMRLTPRLKVTPRGHTQWPPNHRTTIWLYIDFKNLIQLPIYFNSVTARWVTWVIKQHRGTKMDFTVRLLNGWFGCLCPPPPVRWVFAQEKTSLVVVLTDVFLSLSGGNRRCPFISPTPFSYFNMQMFYAGILFWNTVICFTMIFAVILILLLLFHLP